MKRLLNISITVILLLSGTAVIGQTENSLIRSGNRYYKQKDIDRSQQEYQKALQLAPFNPSANYNLGNTQFRKNSFEDAVRSYDASISNSIDSTVKEKGWYNKGVAQIRQQKLEESIESWKNALKLDPSDLEARENLEKALQELRMKQPKQQPKDQQQNQQQQPKQQQSRLSKQQVEQLLKALQQKEREVQDKMNQNKSSSPNQPDKDW